MATTTIKSAFPWDFKSEGTIFVPLTRESYTITEQMGAGQSSDIMYGPYRLPWFEGLSASKLLIQIVVDGEFKCKVALEQAIVNDPDHFMCIGDEQKIDGENLGLQTTRDMAGDYIRLIFFEIDETPANDVYIVIKAAD